jgi:signal transduction histidine kinase
MKFKIILFIFIYAFGFTSYSEPIIFFKDSTESLKIGGDVLLIEDKNNDLTLEQVVHIHSGKMLKNSLPKIGLSNSAFWIKFNVINRTKSNLILKFNQPRLNKIIFYSNEKNNLFKEISYGEDVSIANRQYKYPAYYFDLNISKGDTGTYIVKFSASEPIVLDVEIETESTIISEEINNELILGMYIGIIFVMAFYNLFIYFTTIDTSYLYYVVYIISVGLTQITIQGYGHKYIWPDLYYFDCVAVILFSTAGAIAAIEFMKVFLQTKIYVPLLHKFLLVFEIIFILGFIIHFTNYKLISFSIVQFATLALSIYILVIATIVFLKGFRPAIFFLISWIILLIAAFVFISKDFGLFPYNFITTYSMQIGSGLEITLLSFALADRINIFKKEKETSQAQALEALLQNELIIRNQNIVLENKVEERTKKLQDINEELYITLSELKQTQSQLVNSEKMASLGQLTAGIAHEINNPINFVVSNVKPLKRDIEEIYELINLYDTINIGDTNSSEKIIEVRKYRKEIDYDYLKQEISHMIKGIEDGAIRTAEIVKGLRVFSRLDENDLKRTDINEGINATLTLLNPEISGSIDLVKNFEHLPKIECFPGKLNQVFMNILNNAIYAIKENTKRTEKGKLEITTTFDDQFVRINIKDNGIGMSEEVRKKIFDPFFTTKPVGKGTGLGMSITFSIINDHRGVINLHTKYSIGTEFIIQLPIDYKN